ncbi:hypothetical protein Tco_0787613 [Tanacetum coccineum]
MGPIKNFVEIERPLQAYWIIGSLKDDLRKLKGKALVDNVVTKHSIDPEMLKINVEPITPKLLNKKTAHSAYIKHTQEKASVLRDLVEQVKSKYPLDHSLESAYRITTTTEVPLRKPTALDNETPKPVGSKFPDVPSSRLMNGRSSKLFSGTIKFGNDHVAKILGYGDYQIRNVTISRVYYVEGHDTTKTPVMGTKIENSNLKLLFVTQRRYLLHLYTRATLLYVSMSHATQRLSPGYAQTEAVATACYTQNRSIIRLRHGKTPYELLHDKLPDLSFFHVFGALCYPTNDSENLGKLQPKADIDFDELTTMASEHSSSGPTLHEMTPATPTTISSGLMPNPPPSRPFVPTSRTDWDILFQPLFDELLNPSSSVDRPAPEVIAPIDEVVAP